MRIDNRNLGYSFMVLLFTCASPDRDLMAAAGSLEARIQLYDASAIRVAIELGRRDMTPLLESVMAAPIRATEPAKFWAQVGLARFGQEKYLRQIVQELVHPSSAAAYKIIREEYNEAMTGASPEIKALASTDDVQRRALEKLALVDNERTVQYIAEFLYDNRPYVNLQPWRHGAGGNMSLLAAEALARMHLKDPPVCAGPAQHDVHERLLAWRNWWENHKDYYRKLTPILLGEAPTAGETTRTAVVSSKAIAPSPGDTSSVPVPAPSRSGNESESSSLTLPLGIGLGALALIGVVAVVLRQRVKRERES